VRARTPPSWPLTTQAASCVVASYPHVPTLLAIGIGIKALQCARQQQASAKDGTKPGHESGSGATAGSWRVA
jgi:hypothetical protein